MFRTEQAATPAPGMLFPWSRDGSALEQRETTMARIRANPLGGNTYGTAEDDVIDGSAFFDFIRAGAGDDAINAGTGNDVIVGGGGADKIDGGEGTDTVDFSTAAANNSLGFQDGVSVDLHHGVGNWGEAQGDTYVSIENVIGTRYDDAIRGNAGNNVLSAGSGDDNVAGGAGADTMSGGEGNDTLSYFYFATPSGAAPQQSSGVYVNLATNTASGGHAQGDIISGFENVMGSAGKDKLIGSDGDNRLEGYSDNDAIDGAGGNDTLDGGSGSDKIHGGKGTDMIIGGTGDDTMAGGLDADTFVFNVAPGDIGNDRLLDFEIGIDTLMMNLPGSPGMGGLNFAQVGNDTVITYDNAAGSLTLVGVSATDLLASDFEIF